MKTVNVGVIGVGAMGENHVRVYHKMEEANLLAVSDVSERALKKIEKKYGAKGYTEYSELLKNPEIEAVSVCVPTTFHHNYRMVEGSCKRMCSNYLPPCGSYGSHKGQKAHTC